MRLSMMLVAASSVAILCAVLSPAMAQNAPPGIPGADAAPPAGPPAGPPPGPRTTLADIHVREGLPASEGRGAPFPPIPETMVGADLKGIQGGMGPAIDDGRAVIAARNGDVPAGVTPLDHDIFSSTDFYKDKDLWNDPRYYRCNSPWGMESAWGSYEAPTVGDDPPRTVGWGFCDRDYDRANIVSPYKYTTAQEHYEALLAEAKSRGGPTKYSYSNPPPDWSGNYAASLGGGFGQLMSTRSWMSGAITQVPTYISLLSPEYAQRMVQQMWHDAHNEVIWPGAFCWPEGFERRWFGPSGGMFIVTPSIVEISGGPNEKLVTDIYTNKSFKTDGRVPYLSQDVRQLGGEAVGFWDGDVLVAWSSNIKHNIAHGWFETSDDLQAIEQFYPLEDKDNKFVGLMHETVLYDDQAFAAPLRIVERLERTSSLDDGPSRSWGHCIQNLFIQDGQQTAASPGDTVTFTVPDVSGRPWADVWALSEKNMDVPKGNDVLAGF